MPRTPEEVLKEVAAWPLEERLRLAARILEAAAAELQGGAAPHPGTAPARSPRPGTSQPAGAPEPGAKPPPGPSPTPPAVRAAPRSTPAPPVAPTGREDTVVPATRAAEPRRLVVVDGSNFLGTVSGFDLKSDSAREELIMRLQEFARDHPALWVVLYFDGQKTSVKRTGRVEVRFTSGQKPADFYILELLRGLAEAQRRHALLVTADRALSESARLLGAKVEAPPSFYQRLPGVRRGSVGERGLSAAEVEDWEEYFRRPPNERGKPGKR